MTESTKSMGEGEHMQEHDTERSSRGSYHPASAQEVPSA